MKFVLLMCVVTLGIFAGCSPQSDLPEITDFDSCVAAGYPVMESYPRQCRAGDGPTYVETLEIEEVVCTQDVLECDDESFVSRDPANNCEFRTCP